MTTTDAFLALNTHFGGTSSVIRTLTVLCAVATASVGGVFFAFSAFVMAGLNRLPSPQGIAAMQSINVTAVRPPLMMALFGTAALTVVLAVHALMHWGDRRALLIVIGAAVYVMGAVVLTGSFHVPRNDELAALDPSAPGSAGPWASYVREWTAVNHLRALAGVGSSALFIKALLG